MPDPLELVIPTAFGLEAVVGRELRALGFPDLQTDNGRVRVTAGPADICRLNLRLRSGERVLLQLGEFEATDFGQLFDRTTELPWSDWLPAAAAFPVTGKSTRSQLSHVPSCQSIVKKAVVENLKRRYGGTRLAETGPQFPIELALVNDRAALALNTSGPGLHKRGYRVRGGPAPLKETLAAGLVQLSFWSGGRPFWDPFCGTGTIAIEAALLARNFAPGRRRTFAAESWPAIDPGHWRRAREEADDLAAGPPAETLMATDADERAVRAARENARAAGVCDDVHLQTQALSEMSTRKRFGCVVTNPPYGERSGRPNEIDALYREMRDVFGRLQDWSFFVLTSHRELEKLFARRADRRRKLYNGRIACTYYQFHGPKPG